MFSMDESHKYYVELKQKQKQNQMQIQENTHYMKVLVTVMFDSLQSTRLLHLLGIFPGKNTEVGCYFLLQGIFPTQRSNPVSWFAGRFFTAWATREATYCMISFIKLRS